jgi:hypothetical protein
MGCLFCFGSSSRPPPKEGETVRECDAENIDKPQILRLLTSQQTTKQANQKSCLLFL